MWLIRAVFLRNLNTFSESVTEVRRERIRKIPEKAGLQKQTCLRSSLWDPGASQLLYVWDEDEEEVKGFLLVDLQTQFQTIPRQQIQNI